MQKESFYVVWCPNRGNPTHRHPTFDVAKKEASRLALKHRGETFYVLSSCGEARSVDVEWRLHDDNPNLPREWGSIF